jgi:hypothetical protein
MMRDAGFRMTGKMQESRFGILLELRDGQNADSQFTILDCRLSNSILV